MNASNLKDFQDIYRLFTSRPGSSSFIGALIRLFKTEVTQIDSNTTINKPDKKKNVSQTVKVCGQCADGERTKFVGNGEIWCMKLGRVFKEGSICSI